MSARQFNTNAKSKLGTDAIGPWETWEGTDLEKYIRFIESYCHEPDRGGKYLLKMHPYQVDIIATWLDPTTASAMCKLPRANAKSTTTAAFAVAHLFMHDGADIPIVATTMGQAVRTVYGRMVRMIQMEPELLNRAHIRLNNNAPMLEVPAKWGKAYPIADNPAGLMGLNPSLAILDEASESSLETWNALTGASGKSGEGGSKTIGISSPSLDKPDNALLALEQQYKSGVAMPGFVYTEYCAPDDCKIDDEHAWSIANPALNTVPPILTKSLIYNQLATMTEAQFRCYRLGQWVEGGEESWLGASAGSAWDALDDDYDFELGAATWVGLDYAHTYDTAAVVTCQTKPDGTPHFKCKIWKPSKVGGIELQEIGYYLHRLHEDYNLIAVYYDPAGFAIEAEHLENEGLPMTAIKQTRDFMVPTVMNTRHAIYEGEFTHDKDEFWRSQILNAIPHYYSGIGFALKKRVGSLKIDAAVALCLCHQATVIEPAVRDYKLIRL